ncbi:MFS transporter [Chitinimonas sp. BJYL2]|uniref:MFS transporter n=1 Tax=Chitinimonas sp. BJYL2 TaxID=2976696 RepID=UPI0022B3790E|nr:MFS transporter [Chitinimonas sp. BJYL2]
MLALAERLQQVGRPFSKLLLSDTLTVLALMVGQVALPWWIVQQGGAADLAQYAIVTGLSACIAMPLLSPLGDRYPKNRLIMAGLLVMSLAAVLTTLLSAYGHYQLMLIMLAGVMQMIALAIITPAINSISTELVAAEHLSTAMGLQKSAQSLGRLLGPALAGISLAITSIPWTLALHGVLLLVAAQQAMRIPALAVEAQHGYSLLRWRIDLWAGLRASWQIPLERYWTLTNFASWIFLGPAIGMLVPIKVHAMGLSGTWLASCEAALSAGMLLGAFGATDRLASHFSRFHLRVGAGVSQGLALALAGLAQEAWLLLPAFFLCGLANSVLILSGMTHRMLARPQAFRGRMSAVAIMSGQIAGSIGPALAGLALTHYAVSMVYMSFGLIGAAIATSLALVPGFKHFMALGHDEVSDWYGRHHPAAFTSATLGNPTADSRSA